MGLLMERYDLDADTAHDRLLSAAVHQQTPVLDLARGLLEHGTDPLA